MRERNNSGGKVNMVLNVHRNHKAYQGQGERKRGEGEGQGERKRGEGVWRWGEEGDYIPIATLLPPE